MIYGSRYIGHYFVDLLNCVYQFVSLTFGDGGLIVASGFSVPAFLGFFVCSMFPKNCCTVQCIFTFHIFYDLCFDVGMGVCSVNKLALPSLLLQQ